MIGVTRSKSVDDIGDGDDDKKSKHVKKDGSLTTQQLIKKILQDTEEKIKRGEILSGDLTLHRLM
jgi:hypothetical protein